MVDLVASQTLLDGKKNAVMKFTNVSDGSGESAVTKVDASALEGAPTRVTIDRIHYTTGGMGVNILWDADTDLLAFSLAPDQTGCLDFTPFGGLKNNAGDGVNGDVKFTTFGDDNLDVYTVVLEMTKHYD